MLLNHSVTLLGGLVCKTSFCLCFAGLVQKLIDRGKHVLAVKYIFGFNLVDKFPPVPILKAHVNESEKLGRRLAHEGKSVVSVSPLFDCLVRVATVFIHFGISAEGDHS